MAESVLDIKRKFVRLQNHFFGDNAIKEKLQINKMIFPIKLASKNIASLLDYPKANNIKFFKYTDYRLASIRVSNDISSIEQNFNIIGVERDKKFIIPFDEDVIQKDDLVYFFGLDEDIKLACSQLDTIDKSKIQKCVVFGGGKLAISIAKELLNIGRDVKLVEKDLELCEWADEELKGQASVINSKYGTIDLFEEEGLSSADFFIAATNNDEFNIIKCLEAQEKGIRKVVAINNEMEYYNLMHSLGIIVARGPKMSAYNTIMEHIDSSGVVIQKSFCGAMAVVFMRKIFPNSRLINKKTKPPKVDNSNIFYIRENKFYNFDEKITLFENDLLIAFSNTQNSTKIKQWIYEL
jgi:trk system potassium uptake protein TrkA